MDVTVATSCSGDRARGSALIYATIALMCLMGFVSLGVDYGRARMAKTQLQDAVDAAARYAATGLSDSSYLAKAQAAASENRVDSSTLALLAGDVEAGTWDTATRVFTAGGSTPNAIRITGRRTAARGTAIPTIFGRAVGMNSVDVTATAVASISGASHNIISLNSISLTGATFIRRQPGEGGTVNVATNGTTNVAWGCGIQGNLAHRTSVPTDPGSGITGTKTVMASNLAFAKPTVPAGTTNLGAFNVDWSGRSLSAGTYRAGSITLGGGGTLTISGNVTIYCTGNATLGNGAVINTNGTTNKLTIYMTGNNPTINFNMSSTYYMVLYAPTATMNLTGSSPMVGSVLVKNLNVSGSATLSYTPALALPGSTGGSGGGTITTVK